MAATPSQQLAIANVYIALFNRAPDASGFVFWTQALANGVSLAAVTASFVTTPEARAIYPASQTADQFVAAFYQTVFGRTVDAGGLTFWTGVLNSNGGPGSSAARADLVSKLVAVVSTPLTAKPADLTDAQYAQTVADRDLFAKKGVAALNFALNANSDDLNLARQVVAAVGAPPVTPDPGPSVDPLAFTSGIDALTGTVGNDTFTADNSNSAARKLTAGDSVDGGLGIDTVRYRAAAGDTGLTLGTFNRVEKLYVTGGAAISADLRSATSLTELEFDAIGGTLDLTLAGTQTAVITANNGAAVQNVRLAYGATDTSANVVLKGSGKVGNASAINVAGAALTTLNLSATGGVESAVQFGNNGVLTTLNLSGDAKLSVSESFGSLTTIDGSAATGNLTITHTGSRSIAINAGAGVDTIISGDGNDVIGFAAGNLTADDTVDGGLGTDTLLYRAATGDTGLTLGNLSRVEKILVTSESGITADVHAMTDLVELQFAGILGALDLTVSSAQTVAVIFNNSSTVQAVRISYGAADTSGNLVLRGSGNAGNASLTTVAGAALATLNLTATGDADSAVKLVNEGAALTTLNVSGGRNLELTEAIASLTLIDASTATGNLNIKHTGANGVSIKAGSGVDSITTGAGDDVIAFAAGKFTAADTVDVGTGRDTLQIADAAPDYTLINRITGLDVLSLGASAAVDIAQVATTIQSFVVANTGTTSFTNAKSTSTFVVDNSQGVAAVSIGNLGGQTTADITVVNNSAVPGAKTLGALTVSGAAQISLTSSGSSGNVITQLTAADGATITVKGAAALQFSLAAGVASGSTVNAALLTGKLDVTGSDFDDTITGGAGADVIRGGAGADMLNGGDGADVINGGAGVDTLSGGAGNDEFVLLTQADTRGAGFSGTNTNLDNIEKIPDWARNGTSAGDTIRIGANHFASLVFSASTIAKLDHALFSNGQAVNTVNELLAIISEFSNPQGSSNSSVQFAYLSVDLGSMAGSYVIINDHEAGLTINDTIISVGSPDVTFNNVVAQDFVFG